MTADYLQKSAGSLNTIFQLYKAKLKDLPQKDEVDPDNVAEWFGRTLNDFVAFADTISDKDVANFASHFASACLADLQDKYSDKPRHTEYRWLGEISDIESFIASCKAGDSVRYKGVTIEIKKVD